MFKKIVLIFLLLPQFLFAQMYTAFEPGNIWNDTEGNFINAHGAGILKVKDTYYMFGEVKGMGEDGGKASKGVSCYSSKDLYNWKNEGIALKVLEDTTSMLQIGCVIERPKVVYNKKTKKFVMWFHHELKDKGYAAALAGCAVADKITGPYIYVNSVRPAAGNWPSGFTEAMKNDTTQEKYLKRNSEDFKQAVVNGLYVRRDFKSGQMSRDMTVYMDDDDKAYLITASEENQTLQMHELSNDYKGFTGKYYRIFPGGKNEAPAIFKKDGKYFMITSGLTGWNPNAARSAVAAGITGEWQSLGNPCRGTETENKNTFKSQSTFIIPVFGKKVDYIFMADRWKSENLYDSRYIWLPIEFEDGKPVLKWREKWTYN